MCSRITAREDRSTSVPIADRFPAPMIRSPSQLPGTDRSVASAGPLVDHRHGDKPAPAPLGATPRFPATPSGAQPPVQVTAQPTQLRPVDRLVDGLGCEVPLRMVRKPPPQ